MNEQSWKDKICKECKHRQLNLCREREPNIEVAKYDADGDYVYKPACAEYKENV